MPETNAAPSLHETVAAASTALGRELSDPVDLGGSRRSHVLRCRDGERTVVVKQFFTGDGEHVREAVGLALLDRTPVLLAQDDDAHLVVMEDLGDHLPTLADLLLGTDRDAAWSGARSWAHDLGAMLGRSRAVVEQARSRLETELLGGPSPWDAVADLRAGLGRLAGLAPSDTDVAAIEAELAGVGALLAPGDAAVLWPTDTCPDNAVLADGWRFLDLEGADVGHAALAAAYTVLPFATCWCVFDPPPDLTDDLLAAFEEGLAERAPQIPARPEWRSEVEVACAAYVVLVTGWLLNGALEGRPTVGPAGRSPSYRQLVAARWRWGAANLRESFPALARSLAGAASWAWQSWGTDAETTGYPAFA